MLFPTTSFAIFFAAVFTANWLLSRFPTRWRLFMIAASYFFYAWWDWRLMWLLAASTVISQTAALAVARAGGRRGRKLAMAAGVGGNLGLLCWFKYYGFFAVSLDKLPRELESTHINLNDGTLEGFRHRRWPIFAVQYHPEASAGPLSPPA